MILALVALAATAKAHDCRTRHDLAMALLSEPDQPLVAEATPQVAYSEYLDAQRDAYVAQMLEDMKWDLVTNWRREVPIPFQEGKRVVLITGHYSPEWSEARVFDRLTACLSVSDVVHLRVDPYVALNELFGDVQVLNEKSRDVAHERRTQQRHNQLTATSYRQRVFAPRHERQRRGAPASRLATMGLSWQRQG